MTLSVRESDGLKVLLLFVHHVDYEGEAAVEVVVEDAAVLNDRSHDLVEEAPHSLRGTRLIVEKFDKCSKTLISRLGAVVV